MSLSVYLSFVAYACATTFLPGPNNVLLLSAAGRFGIRRCVPLLLGIWTGLVTVMMLAGFLCNVLGTWVPQVVPFMKYVGAAYIVYLAWKTLWRGNMKEGGQQEDKPLKYHDGFLLQFLNVKVIMLGLASYPGYFMPYGGHPLLVLLFAVTMTACCGTGNMIWAIAGNFIRPVYNKYYKIVNAVMTLLLIYCAVKILTISV